MANRTVLCIDGRNGIDSTTDRQAHLRDLRLKRLELTDALPSSKGENGLDGVSAPLALPGEPGGGIAAEITCSQEQKGGITVKMLGQVENMRSPLVGINEVQPRTAVHFSAVGGNGETGRMGGAGSRGSPGRDGVDATREVDATDGGAGGTGGAGGVILLYVDEDQTELLHGVTWDISGGQGGGPGQHGEPGEGGPGGQGGKAAVWEDITHYIPECTPYCVGGSSEVAMLPSTLGGGHSTIDMFRQVRDEINRTNSGSLMSTAITTVASKTRGVGKMRRLRRETRIRKISKPAGRNGAVGATGVRRLEKLLAGNPGEEGRVEITVRHRNSRHKYSSAFKLELVGFDVEDENADGIFEPGEDIFVRRIRVRNKGGMPSPSTAIPCELIAAELVQCSSGEVAFAPLKTSIAAGNTEYSEAEIRGSLRMPVITANSLPPYRWQQKINLRAVFPWLQQPLPEFDASNQIKVQFPLELRDIKLPTSLPPGCPSTVKWEITNKSSRAFGHDPDYPRAAKVLVSIDSALGEILDKDGNGIASIELNVASVPLKETITMSQRIRIKSGAGEYLNAGISLQLFITTPKHNMTTPNIAVETMQLIETHKNSIQVAPRYVSSENNDDDILIVTNPATRKSDLDAITNWLKTHLSLKPNIWNIGVYGGLLRQDPNDEGCLENILPTYAQKSVLFLGNQFSLCDEQALTALKICDALSLQEACAEQTWCLFFGINGDRADRALLGSLLRPVEGDPVARLQSLSEVARFHRQEDLVSSLQHTTSDGRKFFALIVKKSRLRKATDLSGTAKSLSRLLRTKIPQKHFIICIVPGAENGRDEDGQLLVWSGFSRISRLESSTADLLTSVDHGPAINVQFGDLKRRPTQIRRKETTLTVYDRFCILRAVPVSKRIELLENPSLTDHTKETKELIELSLAVQIDDEIQYFLEHTQGQSSADLRDETFLQESLPSVYHLMSSVSTEAESSPELFRVVACCLASIRPQSTGKALFQALLPFRHRRKQLFKHIAKMTQARPPPSNPANGKFVKRSRLLRRSDSSLNLSGQAEDQWLDLLEGRCVAASLAKYVNDLTGKSTHIQRQGRYGINESLERNDIWSMDEWNQQVARANKHQEEVLQLFYRFQDEREQDVITGAGIERGEDQNRN